MVIGTVVEGLDIVDRIALQPLEGQGTQRARSYEPLDPVMIESVEVFSGSDDSSLDQGTRGESETD